MVNKNTSKKKFCSYCGGMLVKRCPEGDHCDRFVCDQCGDINYENPKILVACFATYNNKLLWMKRKIAPMAGYWFIPTGFMELGESPEEATARELKEETGVIIKPDNLQFFLMGSLPHISEVYLSYYGEIEDINLLRVTDEASEVALFSRQEVPWDKLAFPSVLDSFELFYNDHNKKKYGAYKAQFSNNKHVISPLGLSKNY